MNETGDGLPQIQLSRIHVGQLWVNGFGDICEIALCKDVSLPVIPKATELAYIVKEENDDLPYESRNPVAYWPVLIITHDGRAFHNDKMNQYSLLRPLEVSCPF